MTASLLRANALSIPLADETVDCIITSPPYFALRSYQDDGGHYYGQIGSEPTPKAFLDALWAVTAECKRVLKPSGSMFVNLGDKYAGSGGHNNSNLPGNTSRAKATPTAGATRRSAPDRYNQEIIGGARPKSLMGLPWRYAIGCIDRLDLILRAEIIWSKPNGLPESVTDRPRRSHEQWFMFTKEPRYYSAIDEIREPHIYADDTTRHLRGRRNITPNGSDASGNTSGLNPLGKLPGSVWTIPSEPLKVPTFINGEPWGRQSLWSLSERRKREAMRRLWAYAEACWREGDPCNVFDVDHFAAFPQEWPRRLILGWTPSGICIECGEGRRPVTTAEPFEARGFVGEQQNSGRGWHGGDPATRSLGVPAADRERTITGYACACDQPTAPTRPAVVLDPFAGTGTTVMVARALGRYGVGLDLSSDYLRLARWRVFQSGHASKSVARMHRENQGTLL